MMAVGPANPMAARPAIPPRSAASRRLNRLRDVERRDRERNSFRSPRGCAHKPERGGKGNRDDKITHDPLFLPGRSKPAYGQQRALRQPAAKSSPAQQGAHQQRRPSGPQTQR
jgi:hypothetical protein